MADIHCPNCGKNNPDFLDFCQFCQAPLKPESVLRIGDSPTKKNTGELESILPEWLRDVRQQARDSAEEEAAQTTNRSKAQNEPPDLLAGLASQVKGADEEEVPDWLASLNAANKPKSTPSSTPAPESDFFAQFDQSASKPASEPPQEEIPSWEANAADQQPAPPDKDELSEWFVQTSEQPEEIVEFDSDVPQSGDMGWGTGFDTPLSSRQESAPKEEEDLSWLRNLEEAAKQTGDLKAPKQGTDWMANAETLPPSQPSGSQEDLSWLDSLGGIEEPQQPTFEQNKMQNDLSWLDQLGNTQASGPSEEAEEKPSSPEDLSWLNNLGAVSEPSPPFDAAPEQPVSPHPFASEEDLNWLKGLGGTAEPAQPFDTAPDQPISSQPFASEEELDWLKGLGGQSEPLSTPPFEEPESKENVPPPQTAPLGGKEPHADTEPDWLKSATEAPSMPAPGNVSMDWFKSEDQPADEKQAPSTPQPAQFSDIFSVPTEPSSLSNQDVDSLFSLEMPDWLSRPEPGTEESTSSQATIPPTESKDSLAPVDLPSWVQAMRPIEATISETTPSIENQPEEQEGPLAGLRGVIPGAPIGSSMRPKAISLKLQATEEQQTSAALLEEILGSETSPRALISSSFIVSQHALRWILSGLFIVVLSALIILRSQTMPISLAPLPSEMQLASDAIESIPDNGRVLIIVDYEPALSGEMEAVGAPVLSHMVVLHHPTLSFLSTSPNGSGLVARLMTNIGMDQAGTQYCNLGYLPGGATGVLGFIESPSQTMPSACAGANVESFSGYNAVILMTDHAESGRIWVEQLDAQRRNQIDPALAQQPLLVVASAQAGPLLQPYISSGQIKGIISGLSNAARYGAVKNAPSGIARSYWDTFGIGLAMSIALIIAGGLWSVFTGIRARRAEAEQG